MKNYKYPDWYRDAKFGIWAHWTTQCVPEQGDWYARNMYIQGTPAYEYHVKTYGHPSKFGFKDIDHIWLAEKWDPEKLISLYKRAGAKYFFALGTHHDNLDCFDSKYTAWNSVNVGPKKDIVGTWPKDKFAINSEVVNTKTKAFSAFRKVFQMEYRENMRLTRHITYQKNLQRFLLTIGSLGDTELSFADEILEERLKPRLFIGSLFA